MLSNPTVYVWLADAVLALHVGVVLFVLGGWLAVVVGNLRQRAGAQGWGWVNRLWFRLLHLAAIAVVVAEAWLGIICPLTTLEMALRAQAQALDGHYSGSFVAYWLQRLLYYDAPPWVFILVYSLFGLLVLASWWLFPPTRKGSRSGL